MSAALVKELRERTGLGLLECKKALAACEGDVERAIEELRKSSGMKAAKKSGSKKTVRRKKTGARKKKAPARKRASG